MSRPVCWHEPLVSGCPDCFAFLMESASSLSQLEEMLKSGWRIGLDQAQNGDTRIGLSRPLSYQYPDGRGPTLSSAIAAVHSKVTDNS